ncbi:unnamed protein product [Effrenium voratum]|nr:unnamed protein product [Effrenium voratum]
MGAGASAYDNSVVVASPLLRDDEDERVKFRGANQSFYDQTLRMLSKNDVNEKMPGHGPDISRLAKVEVEHMLKKEIERAEDVFYKDPSRKDLQREACIETRRARIKKSASAASMHSGSRRGSLTGSGSVSPPLSPKGSVLSGRMSPGAGSMSPKGRRNSGSLSLSGSMSPKGKAGPVW